MNKMTIKDDLLQLKLIFSELHKNNSDGEFECPFLFNFISVHKYWLTIRKNRNGKYCLVGKMPKKYLWQTVDHDKYTDCFYASDELSEVKDQFYILGSQLMALYLKVK